MIYIRLGKSGSEGDHSTKKHSREKSPNKKKLVMNTTAQKRTTESNLNKVGTSQIREGTTMWRIARWTSKQKTRVQSNLGRTFFLTLFVRRCIFETTNLGRKKKRLSEKNQRRNQ